MLSRNQAKKRTQKPKKTDGFFEKAKKPYNDNENDNDIDIDIDNEEENNRDFSPPLPPESAPSSKISLTF